MTVTAMTGAVTVDEGDTPEPKTEESAGTAVQTADPAPARGAAGKVRAALAVRWRAIAVGALLLVAAALASVLYFTVYRTDQRSDPAAVQRAVDAASSGTVTLLSYAPDTLDRDMDRARSVMTGEFLNYYGKFSADVVAPAVRDKGIKAAAQVMNAAPMEVGPDTAKVVVFLNQETVSRARPQPALTASSVVVSLTKVNGTWLISGLDPV